MALPLASLLVLPAAGQPPAREAEVPELNATTPPRPWYQVYESRLKTGIFYFLSCVVLVGFLGDQYYTHLGRQRRKQRRLREEADAAAAPKPKKLSAPDRQRQELLTEAVRSVVQRHPKPDATNA
ncbi:unnamed protein product [Effrenium voratum]|uniref:Uncharacterized protein n=1 Tax=Effrenium voratum TaxID=2562239 RepID=A0AA36IYZ1_9DINO|nr:unnamed protein product [Effrenium voratum]CAJ1423456.1 unnamed protein product [Effrenium voratum]